MQLFDRRLGFARSLIEHWLHIRRSGLVPYQEDVDPSALGASLRFIAIADIATPETAIIQVAEIGPRERYRQTIAKTHWFRHVPQRYRKAVDKIRQVVIDTPCGIYYEFSTAPDHEVARHGETLALPLRSLGGEKPAQSISLTRDLSMEGVIDAGALARLRLEKLLVEFVDVGAGIPQGPLDDPLRSDEEVWLKPRR